MLLNKNELLAMGALKTEVVTFNDKQVRVSEIAATDYSKIWKDCVLSDDLDKPRIDVAKFNALLLVYCLVDEDGNRIFADEDVDCFARYAQAPFSKMVIAAKKLNGLMGDEGNDSEPTEGGSSIGA